MKITDIRTITLRYEGQQFFDAVHSLKTRTCVIVEVHTDEGLVGIGEAAGRPEVIRAIIEGDLAPMLLGQDSFQIERFWATQWTRMGSRARKGYVIMAMGGIDIALWDLMGKAARLPVYQLLGGFASKIPAYASGGFYAVGKGIPELVEEARGFVAQGFRMMKMKVGRLPSALWVDSDLARSSLLEDIKRVTVVREVLGPERHLMVDANCVWDAATAIKMGGEGEK